jgi:hypothetical protein
MPQPKPSKPPAPFGLTDEEFVAARRYIERFSTADVDSHERYQNQRVLVEILAALRRIEGRLAEQGPIHHNKD